MTGLRFQRGGHLAINLVLVLLAGQAVAVDEQKFRAEQPDALRAVGDDGFDVILVFDVRGEVDGFAVERDGGLALDFAEFFVERRLDFRQLAVFKQRLVGRIDDDGAVVAVEQRVIAALQFLADVLQADDGGNVQRPRHDGRVRGLAADVGGKAEHEFFVQLRGGGRAQIVADQDARLVQMTQIKGVLDLEQIVEHARGEVAQIGGAFAQILVLHLRQRGDIALGHGMKGKIGVDLLLADEPDDLLDEHAVFEHQQVRVKNVRLRRAHAGGDAALHLGDLLAGFDERLLEAADLPGDFRVRQVAPRDGVPGAVQNKNLAAADAGGNGDAAIHFFSLKLACHAIKLRNNRTPCGCKAIP